MKKIHYGILSTASIVPRFIKGVQLSADGEVVALASRNYQKARNMADQHHIEKAYGDYDELFQDEDIDVVYISTPNYLHYEHCMSALKACKHVVCEKPFMLTKKEALEVFAFAKEQNLFVMEAQKSVFLPISKWLKESIEQKLVGDISFVRLSSYYAAGDDKEHWMYDHKKGGGVFYGSGSYTIEYMKYLFDKPIISSQGNAIIGPTGVDEIGTINLNINNEHLITTTISRLAPIEAEAIFYGDKGKIKVPFYWRPKQATVVYNDEVIEEVHLPFESEFVYEVDHINECINKGLLESPIMSKQVTLECIEIIESIVEKDYK
ncbi:Gfo/Idh/MocA family protein [Breznakia pachnodae]|uniref:Dehydrogenase n=1 Tax=Breznakia pachnodae TaxID=265178 RepID=A0ABU0E2A3_9FIRM|nr:Gfo/Idh/MocA family oxidoreductase [Breznakia pachnodae]MDQ0361023.1 putative dehydrogenase [Breznakia pachnodae]